jgi:hypothetical protein
MVKSAQQSAPQLALMSPQELERLRKQAHGRFRQTRHSDPAAAAEYLTLAVAARDAEGAQTEDIPAEVRSKLVTTADEAAAPLLERHGGEFIELANYQKQSDVFGNGD